MNLLLSSTLFCSRVITNENWEKGTDYRSSVYVIEFVSIHTHTHTQTCNIDLVSNNNPTWSKQRVSISQSSRVLENWKACDRFNHRTLLAILTGLTFDEALNSSLYERRDIKVARKSSSLYWQKSLLEYCVTSSCLCFPLQFLSFSFSLADSTLPPDWPWECPSSDFAASVWWWRGRLRSPLRPLRELW